MNYSEALADAIKEEKKSFLDGIKPDCDGYYDVPENRFVKHISKCCALLIQAYESSTDIKVLDHNNLHEKIFYFNKIRTSIDHQTINKQTNQQNGKWRDLKAVKPSFVLSLKDCHLPDVNFEARFGRDFFSEIALGDHCKIGTLTLGDMLSSHVKCFSAENCFIENTQLTGGTTAEVIFSECDFRFGLTAENIQFGRKITFKKCHFNRLKSDDEAIPRVDKAYTSFNNTEFRTTTEFINCKFHKPPKFHGATFHSDTSFHLSEFFETKSSSSVGDYRSLKQSMEQLGAEQDAMIFHALEMDSRRNTILPKIWKFWDSSWHATVASWFIKVTTDYGRNFWLPWVWLIISMSVFAGIYFVFDGLGCNQEKMKDSGLWIQNYCSAGSVEYWKISFAYSFQRLWGPLGLILDSGLISPVNFLMKLVSMGQFILSSVIWYILIVQLRRQFKL
jgi:hypothetical protein